MICAFVLRLEPGVADVSSYGARSSKGFPQNQAVEPRLHRAVLCDDVCMTKQGIVQPLMSPPSPTSAAPTDLVTGCPYRSTLSVCSQPLGAPGKTPSVSLWRGV